MMMIINNFFDLLVMLISNTFTYENVIVSSHDSDASSLTKTLYKNTRKICILIFAIH